MLGVVLRDRSQDTGAGSLFSEVGAGGLAAGAGMVVAMMVESKAKSSKDYWVRRLGRALPFNRTTKIE